jgi:hypothetical protein
MVDLKKINNYINIWKNHKNILLGVNDESKLKYNEIRKLNEWNKVYSLSFKMWSFQFGPIWNLFHSPLKEIKWILLQMCMKISPQNPT